jgi:hypothetical protein
MEIESAVSRLPDDEFEQIALSVFTRLRSTGRLPQPRNFTAQRVQSWIDQDEADMANFLAGQ